MENNKIANNQIKEVRLRYFYPTDFVVMITSIVFALFSFINMGKESFKIGVFYIDRELYYGVVFLMLFFLAIGMAKFANGSKNKVVKFFRLFYVQVYYIIFFNECIKLSQLFYNNKSFDFIFAKIDYLIFHYQPSMVLFKNFEGYRWINELLFFSYFFYYFLITTGWWLLFVRGKKKEAAYNLWIITTSFCILYIYYSLFPVKGPKFYFKELNNIWYYHFKGYIFTDLMKQIFNTANLGGAAFPSSHVAISLISLFLNRKYNSFLIPIFFPFTILLFISTVYLYAHYFIDVLFGIFTGIFLYLYIPNLYNFFKRAFCKLEVKIARIFDIPELIA